MLDFVPSNTAKQTMNRWRLSGNLVLVTCICLSIATSVCADQPAKIKVMSYNIHHAEGVDRKLDIQRIAKVIRSVNPDIVALQEVDRNTKRTRSIDQPQQLARLTEMQVAFGGNIALQGGQYGNAVLSRHPITQKQNYLLPNLDNGEQRGVLVVEIDVTFHSSPILFLATHFDHRRKEDERVASAKFINELISNDSERPALLAGDLNATINSTTLGELTKSWKRSNIAELPTIPVGEPSKQIDFILFRPHARWHVTDVTVLDEKVASDHRAIVATLEFIHDKSVE